jgi:hypothetical protein
MGGILLLRGVTRVQFASDALYIFCLYFDARVTGHKFEDFEPNPLGDQERDKSPMQSPPSQLP